MRVVPARSGWSWLVAGFALFRKNPPMWLFLIFTYFIAVMLLGRIPYIGVVASTVLFPAFSVSFMMMCAALEHGGMLRPALLFSGFRSELRTLILLGILQLLSFFAVLGIAALADAGALWALIISGTQPPEEVLLDGGFLTAVLVASLAAAPVLMGFWFAPVLAAWNRIGTAQCLFYSFFAVWRNWRPFLVYSTSLFLAGTLIMTAVMILAQGSAQVFGTLSLVVTLLVSPTLYASFYASYRDIFPENPVPAEQPSNAGSP